MKADDQRFAVGFSSPVVAGDAVIVGLSSLEEVTARENATFRGGVVAFDRRSGKELWRYRTAEPPNNGVGVWSSVSVDTGARTVFATRRRFREYLGRCLAESVRAAAGAIRAVELAQAMCGGSVR